MGPSTGTRMRGWGVGATWGPRSPHSWPARTATFRACLRREGRGHLSRAGRGRLEKHSDFSPMDCTEGFGAWGTGPAAQDGVAEHPPFWKHETSSRRCPFPSQGWGGALVAQGKGSGISRLPCLTQSRPRSQRQGREGGREGVESAGESPGDLHPINDGIPVELFQILKDDAVKVLHSICQQIWKTQQSTTGLENWAGAPTRLP